MKRRSYLVALGTAATAATAGCLTGGSSSGPDNVVLPQPEDQVTDSESLGYPAYGQAFPEFELPDATGGTVVDTGELDSVAVVTAFFASCPAECGILLNHLAGVQTEVVDLGLTGDVSFLAITFDPARDDAEALRENAESVGVDLSAGNWHNLRPGDADEVETIVSDQLGVGFERDEDSSRLPGYDFTHIVVTWLVNPDGVVERAYRGELLDEERVLDDIRTVVDESRSTDTE